MPCASARRRASSAGSWPGSSASGRLLMIVRTPAAASASMSAVPSAPAALSPGASSGRGGNGEDMGRLRKDFRADSQSAAAPSSENLGGELSRPLYQIAGADPEPLEPAERPDGALHVRARGRGA